MLTYGSAEASYREITLPINGLVYRFWCSVWFSVDFSVGFAVNSPGGPGELLGGSWGSPEGPLGLFGGPLGGQIGSQSAPSFGPPIWQISGFGCGFRIIDIHVGST